MKSARKTPKASPSGIRAKARRVRLAQSTPADLTRIRHEQLGWLLERVDRLFARLVSKAVHDHGFDDVRLVHVPLIRAIEPDGTRISEIAKRAGITKQATGTLVSEFVQFGYIKIVDHPSDGRVKMAVYTAKGEQLLGACADALKDTEGHFLSMIGNTDFTRLKTVLQRIIIAAED
jgi:DNA-binding MarR family transcriptional regulator